MPFLAPIFTAIGGAIAAVSAWAAASPILAGIVQTAFGIAAKFALGALFKQKQPSQASQLDTTYGSDLVRSVGMGTYGTAGHFVYRNLVRFSNRQIQDVYVVSHFRATALLRIRIEGDWRNLDTPDVDGYRRVLGIDGEVRVKFYNGSMTQTADSRLVNLANPASRWTSAHRGVGMSYVIVYQKLDRDKMQSPVTPFFEIQGAPLYDFRLDSTVGGVGSQRWNDQTTWAYSDNPAIMAYNLERGFYSGTELICGKGRPAARLPLSEWTLAANICDQGMGDGTRRYTAAAISQSGAGVTHDDNMQPLLDAMAGSWVETVLGEYPIAGGPQTPVATIFDEDIAIDQPLRVSLKLPRTQLINTVASNYVSAAKFYESTPSATRIDAAALADDGERMASSISYTTVTEVKQVDRLADIAIRGARYQATADITVKPKFLDTIKVGKWITWNSVKFGVITFQVLMVTLGGLGDSGARDMTLNLRQISNGVFDPTAYVTNPPVITPVGDPIYLNEVANFVVTPTRVTGTTGGQYVAARLSWDAITDITVTNVDIEYRPIAEPTNIFRTSVTSDISVVTITEGLTRLTPWEFRTRLRTSPDRQVAFSAWYPATMLDVASDFFPIDLDDLGNDVGDYLQFVNGQVRELIRQGEELATHVGDLEYGSYSQRQDIRRELSVTAGNITASYLEAITVAVGPGSAIAQSITTLNTKVDTNQSTVTQLYQSLSNTVSSQANAIIDLTSTVNGVSANATFRMQTVAAPAGYTSRIAMQARVDVNDTFKSAGIFLDVTTTLSRVAIIADQFVVASGTDLRNPFIFTAGVLTLNVINVGTVTAGLLQSTDTKMQIQLDGRRILISD